jgi:predicted component of type VI protein secretion system
MEKLKIKEAAEYADKSDSWIRKKILNGQLAAEKEAFKYGERWITTKKAIDDLLGQAKTEKEVVEVREVNKPVAADELINKLLDKSKQQNKKLIDQAAADIKKVITEQSSKIDKQQETISQLSDKLDRIEKRQNKSFIDKVKDFFK